MAKKIKNMNHAELTQLCGSRFAFKKKPTRKEMIFLLSTNEAAKPELSETPVIDGEQATAPTVDKPAEIAPKVTVPDKPVIPHGNLPKSIDEFPTIPRPEVESEPEPVEPPHPVICSACKMIVDSATVLPCLICPKNLVYCPACAKAGTCHKCGKVLMPVED